MTSSWRDPTVPLTLRLHSAAGVVPLGAFFAVHLWLNLRAVQGPRDFETLVRTLQSVPGRPFVELAFIGAPLAYHAIYGTLVVLGRAPSYPEPPHAHPWSRTMQRVTGVTGLLFIMFHLAALRLPVLAGSLAPADFHQRLIDELSATGAAGIPFYAMAYLLGLAAVSYHLANGVVRFCLRLGIGKTPEARRLMSLGCSLAGAILFLLGANTVIYFATGAPLVGSTIQARDGRP